MGSKLNARVKHLHNTEEGWNAFINELYSLYEVFIPEPSELIIYDPDSKVEYSRFKIGDGETPLEDLPFISPVSTDAGHIRSYPKKEL